MRNKLKRTSDANTTEAPLIEAAASVAEVAEVNLAYIGPDYTHGIKVHGEPALIRPKEFTPEEVAKFLERHPERSTWWMPADKL